MDRRRLILYLLLNILISACVTSAILFWYDRTYRSVSISTVQPAGQALNLGAVPQLTLDPQTDIPVEIVSVIGAGTLNAEWVVVAYKGEDQINLTLGSCETRTDMSLCSLKSFCTKMAPCKSIPRLGRIRSSTYSGTAGEPVWQSGEEAQLFDPSGNMRAKYKVP